MLISQILLRCSSSIRLSILFSLLLPAAALYPTEAFMQQTKPKSYLVELKGTRPGWPEDITKDEEKIMEEHFQYLKELTLKGKVLMAGPVFGQFGLIVLRVSGEEEARQIMNSEPSVVHGVHTYDLYEMITSLMANNIYRGRYPAEQSNRELVREAVVKCTPATAWQKWTTNEGVRSFFSPNTNVELRVGGPYEIYFDMSAPPGERGSEDCRILSYLPERMLSFEWNAPPQFGPLRQIKTRVVITFEAMGNDSTKVTLHHVGWGVDKGWNEIYDYFDHAWGLVMDSFSKSIAEEN